MKKRGGKSAEDVGIAELDDFLAAGGFRRASRPQGALARERGKRDARRSPKRPARSLKKPLEVLRAPGWEQEWLVHGFSTRTGGYSKVFGGSDLNLGMQKHDAKAAVEKNRKAFFTAVGAGRGFKLATLKQIHSSHIHVLDAAPKGLLVGDGVITDRPGLLLSIQTADCVPVLLMDPVKKAVGAFHAGWRGTAKRIVEKGVGMMQMRYGSRPADIRAAIGPCIQQCCYAVGPEVVDEFHSQFPYAAALFKDIFDDDPVKKKYPLLFLTARAPGHGPVGKQPHLDLTEANRRQLVEAGVAAENIWVAGLCTGCNTDKLFSHRKEDGFTGRMMAVVGVELI
ncbi:MAG TPA: peptidoglycan editing factor PgeF [Terriglobales bacterium]|nr:peptidoglycan editing factor PgeF [Terriglobales bacterium]